MVILDVAHNEDGVKQLIKQIDITAYSTLHIVFGIVKDKEADKILSLLPSNATYYFTKAQIPRALPEDELQQKASSHNLNGASFPEVNEALKAALENSLEDDLILVCGSVFLVGEVEVSGGSRPPET